jgi:hypothetical protein
MDDALRTRSESDGSKGLPMDDALKTRSESDGSSHSSGCQLNGRRPEDPKRSRRRTDKAGTGSPCGRSQGRAYRVAEEPQLKGRRPEDPKRERRVEGLPTQGTTP